MGGEGMLKRIIQLCFLIVGGAIGIIVLPDLSSLITDNSFITNPIFTGFAGAIIFYIINNWLTLIISPFV